jgi:hypothetical protein
MAGYKNRTITLKFDGTSALDDLGEDIWVMIRNPKLMNVEKLTPREIPLDENGIPKDSKDAMLASYEVMAGLIVKWNVYDADDDSDDPQPLTEVTPENIAKLPMGILTSISDQMAAINPN